MSVSTNLFAPQSRFNLHDKIVDHKERIPVLVLEFHELGIKVKRVQNGGDTDERRSIELQEGDNDLLNVYI